MLAHKYRPKNIEDLIGQDSVVKTLSNAVQNNCLHVAYLFSGQFGSGKTSMARILAAMENCDNGPTLYPCNKCNNCTLIFEGKHQDIDEIDAASSAGGVKEIRKLKESALYNPIAGARTRYYIIDEAHRCSAESLDAMLKLIEEPPPRVRFILCTTDVNKMRPAIQSRCQKHEFKKISWSLLSEHLERICKLEKITYEISALNLCCKLSSGSARNALQNLDKLIAFCGDKDVTSDNAQKLFSQASELVYYDLIDQIIGDESGKPDASEGFRIINKMLSGGVDFGSIYESVAEQLRKLMVGLTSSKAGEFISFSEEGKKRLQNQLLKCKQSQKLGSVLESLRCLHEAKKSVEFNIPTESALQAWLVESIFAFRRT